VDASAERIGALSEILAGDDEIIQLTASRLDGSGATIANVLVARFVGRASSHQGRAGERQRYGGGLHGASKEWGPGTGPNGAALRGAHVCCQRTLGHRVPPAPPSRQPPPGGGGGIIKQPFPFVWAE